MEWWYDEVVIMYSDLMASDAPVHCGGGDGGTVWYGMVCAEWRHASVRQSEPLDVMWLDVAK